jgi:DNA-binding transcriptional regulator LsrR (DeoR family)
VKVQRVTAQDYSEARLISSVLDLYYVQELTQIEIGQRLGMSAAKVSRLLKQAREAGMVEVTIRAPCQHLSDLESRLKAVFALSGAVVIPNVPLETSVYSRTLGLAGAEYLGERVRDGDIVGIGGGTAMHAVAQSLESSRVKRVEVVPILGAVQGSPSTDVNLLAAELAHRLGGRAYQLHAPAFADTPEHRDLLMSVGPIKEVLDIARRANIVFMGIGTVDHARSRFVDFTALSAADMKYIASSCNGVGEIAARVYDIEGCPCAEEYARRVVGLSLEELREIPMVVGVAATATKAVPIYGALRGGYLNTLVTDEAAARGVLELFESDFHT